MELILPPKKKIPQFWQPLVCGYNMNPSHGNQPELVLAEGTMEHTAQKFTPTLRELMNKDYIQLEKNPFRIYHAAFVMGAKAGDNDEKAKVFHKNRYEYRFQSIAEIEESAPLLVFFSNPEAKGRVSTAGWRPFVNSQSANGYQLTLNAGSDIRFIYALLAPATQFAFRADPQVKEDGRGIYLARERKIIAKLDKSPSEQFLARLKKALKADVIYEGNRNAYIGDLEMFKALLSKNKIPNVFYVLHKDKYIEINLEFMKSHPSVGRFLDENATAFFREPITVVKGPALSH